LCHIGTDPRCSRLNTILVYHHEEQAHFKETQGKLYFIINVSVFYPCFIQTENQESSTSIEKSLENNESNFHAFKYQHFSLSPFHSIDLLKDIKKDDKKTVNTTDASCRQSGQILSDEKKAESAALYGNDIFYL